MVGPVSPSPGCTGTSGSSSIGFEAVAGAGILQKWLPDVPLWSMSLGLLLLMTATNLYSVSSYGEFEYWFAGIKVCTICAFLALGSLYVLGLWPGHSLDFSNLTAHGGFFPNGFGSIFSGIVVVIFSMVGAEVATIAAAESNDPERAVARATNSVIARILIFYIGSIFLLAVILPWNSQELGASPFVSAFEQMGIEWVANIMNAVVLTAVLSCLNSGLYTSSRMLFVLAAARRGAGGTPQDQPARRPVLRDPALDRDRLSSAWSPPTCRRRPSSCSC